MLPASLSPIPHASGFAVAHTRTPIMGSLFLLIDIDNTLYEYSETGFHHEMHDRIFAFAQQKVGLTAEQAECLSRKYWLNYGLSLYGYVKEYNVDAKEYSDFVHQCSYDKLHYNKPLIDMLLIMQYAPEAARGHDGPRSTNIDHLYYFTNANHSHARNVLDAQGLRPIFTRPRPVGLPVKENHPASEQAGAEDQVEWLGFSYEDQWQLTHPEIANKPMRQAYEAIYKAIEDQVAEDAALVATTTTAGSGSAFASSSASRNSDIAEEVKNKRARLRPENFVMVDDSLMNIDAPLELGWSAVWYAHDTQELPTDVKDNASAPLYAAAVASGRLQVIRNILELRAAVERIREVNSRSASS
ncbi:conserved hypothetical protein [Leishmania major strain Friedlin]|uniref:5'-nucleotidase n=1 Tax=Leishmania major TaxID=5664 RepID=Q4Q1K7_LEIMA|nr:conserved hypothetical protein [Leishmania major strain Friedlin]CAG9583743.1 hypothetical_protein_-_conserved [Leishmania major strain Friedlin]CAJ09172.1 conserved hypothetical protein [Leishmania major strain Friedlin]|eukprot:XP_001686791.1 conserved hypothetical protein [Leishmania major strain Friedlin]